MSNLLRKSINAFRASQRWRPKVKMIGWDFVLDDDENVIVMEYNTKRPGVLYYQYNNGPLFGSRTEELINYIKSL